MNRDEPVCSGYGKAKRLNGMNREGPDSGGCGKAKMLARMAPEYRADVRQKTGMQ